MTGRLHSPADNGTNPPLGLEFNPERNTWTLLVDNGMERRGLVLTDDMVDALAARIAPPQPTGLQAQVTVVEYANLGDSAAYIRKPLTYDPQETVEALLVRAHGLRSRFRQNHVGERVELQVIQETIPEPNPLKPGDPWDAPAF